MENELQTYMGLDVSSKPVTVHLYTRTLKVEYQDEDLALYTVAWHTRTTNASQKSRILV
jgi:hypothetical protein